MAYVLVKNYKYPFATTYSGYAEQCVFEFSLGPDEVPGTDWIRDQIANAFEGKVQEQGAHMLELRVWEDTAPYLTTNYRIEAIATVPLAYTEAAVTPLAIQWTIVIYGVLLIVLLLVINYTIIQPIQKFWYGASGNGGEGAGAMLSMILPLIIIMMMMNMMNKD